jgi:hypothetical protein
MDYRLGDGKLLTFDQCTAASNIEGGMAATRNIYTLGVTTTGLSTSGVGVSPQIPGYSFIGITDKSYSAGECPVSVWTEGVFKFMCVSGQESADVAIGWPVYADSGLMVSVGTGNTSDASIGTLVNRPAETTGSAVIFVRIAPAVYRWTRWVGCYVGVAYATATQAVPFAWPIHTGHA